MQLRDTRSDAASAWTNVPGTLVRAPSVTKIECTADPTAPCTLIGSRLFSIAGVVDGAGRVVPPGLDRAGPSRTCRTTCCMHLEDNGATTTIPDAAPGAAAAR